MHFKLRLPTTSNDSHHSMLLTVYKLHVFPHPYMCAVSMQSVCVKFTISMHIPVD